MIIGKTGFIFGLMKYGASSTCLPHTGPLWGPVRILAFAWGQSPLIILKILPKTNWWYLLDFLSLQGRWAHGPRNSMQLNSCTLMNHSTWGETQGVNYTGFQSVRAGGTIHGIFFNEHLKTQRASGNVVCSHVQSLMLGTPVEDTGLKWVSRVHCYYYHYYY